MLGQSRIDSAFRKTAETFAAGSRTLPQRFFVAPEIFAEEESEIFSRQWMLVGHQGHIPVSGDYFVADVAGESLIVVRDQQSAIRGFYNTCRHRGTRLKEDLSGHCAVIQCPYHAWTYRLDGRLTGAPHMEEVSGFDKADYPLLPAKIGLWEGFVFANLADSPPPLAEWFSPLKDKFRSWNLPQLRSARRIEYEVHSNWKLIFENYSECYHCPGVHPALAKVSPYDSAENDLSEGPFLGGFMRIAKSRSLTMSGKACALAMVDANSPDNHRIFYYSIFPNMLLSLHPDYVMVHQLRPRSAKRTSICCEWLFRADAFEREDFHPEDAIDFWDMTNRQDWHVCELSQQGIGSRRYQPGPYSSRESIPAAWDREYLRQIRSDPGGHLH